MGVKEEYLRRSPHTGVYSIRSTCGAFVRLLRKSRFSDQLFLSVPRMTGGVDVTKASAFKKAKRPFLTP
jgi:hypothetical protein